MHPFAELSAYVDDALDPTAKAVVETHLHDCAVCRTRLEELRGTARLIAALPAPIPSRSLVPRVSVPLWLAPIRTLATLASAAALFLFVASAALSGLRFGTGAAPAAAPAPIAPNAGAPAASVGAADRGTGLAASASPAAGFAVNPSASPVPAAQRSTQTDATKTVTGTAAPPAAREDAATPVPAATPEPAARTLSVPERPQLGPSPWVWLVLAVGFGALALVLQRRLRAP